jgi:hypothetical protein
LSPRREKTEGPGGVGEIDDNGALSCQSNAETAVGFSEKGRLQGVLASAPDQDPIFVNAISAVLD